MIEANEQIEIAAGLPWAATGTAAPLFAKQTIDRENRIRFNLFLTCPTH
jgi:hypothetical protein